MYNVYAYTGQTAKDGHYAEYISVNEPLLVDGLNFTVRSSNSQTGQMITLSIKEVRELHTALGEYLDGL